MSSPSNATQPSTTRPHSENAEHSYRWRVFAGWCLSREAFKRPYLLLFVPLVVSAWFFRNALYYGWYPGQGIDLFQTLLGMTAFIILIGGVRHASRAVCWEVSRDLRDLVRLTAIDPAALLWCQTLSRWWTIGLSIILLLPLAMFARTLGGGTSEQWIAGGSWLVLWALLTSGFAAIATVSTGHVSNAETTAAWATVLLMFLYHLIFWGIGAVIWITCVNMLGLSSLQAESFGRSASAFTVKFAPVSGLYQAISSPLLFSPLEATYWVHFVTGILCLRMASIVMRSRFRVTTQGDRETSELPEESKVSQDPPFMRPRCGDRPFFWKDAYILGGGAQSKNWWSMISLLSAFGVIVATGYGVPTVVGITAICLAPCLIAVRFDALLAAEFRGKTWAELMLLPIDPLTPLIAKVQAAVWERQAIFWPVGIAALIAGFSHLSLVLMSAVIALIAGILMIEIAILNQFNTKLWWASPIVGGLVIGTIAMNIIIWAILSRETSFLISTATLTLLAAGFFLHIRWRLRNWGSTTNHVRGLR